MESSSRIPPKVPQTFTPSAHWTPLDTPAETRHLPLSICEPHGANASNLPLHCLCSQHPLLEGHQDLREWQKQHAFIQLREVQLHRGLPEPDQTFRRQSKYFQTVLDRQTLGVGSTKSTSGKPDDPEQSKMPGSRLT